MRTQDQILSDIELIKQEIRYARAEGDEAEVEMLYSELEALQNELLDI